MVKRCIHCAIICTGLIFLIASIFWQEFFYYFLLFQLIIGVVQVLDSLDTFMRVRHVSFFKYRIQNYWITVVAYFALTFLFICLPPIPEYELTVPIIWFIILPWLLAFHYAELVFTYQDFISTNNYSSKNKTL